MKQRKIIGIVGSLRRASLNRALMRAAVANAPSPLTIEMATLESIPLYDGDLEESEGIPSAVEELKNRLAESDGILIATPEYNAGMPGVLKNALDWCSRGGDTVRVFGGKPLGLMGATPGAWGTRLAQTSMLPVLRQLGVDLWGGGQMYVARAHEAFEDGELTDERTRGRLAKFLEGFAGHVSHRSG
jgi:chromate reductase